MVQIKPKVNLKHHIQNDLFWICYLENLDVKIGLIQNDWFGIFYLENLEVKIGLIFWIFSMNCCGESRTCCQDISKGKCTEKYTIAMIGWQWKYIQITQNVLLLEAIYVQIHNICHNCIQIQKCHIIGYKNSKCQSWMQFLSNAPCFPNSLLSLYLSDGQVPFPMSKKIFLKNNYQLAQVPFPMSKKINMLMVVYHVNYKYYNYHGGILI